MVCVCVFRSSAICEDESAAAAWKPDVSIDATDSERRVDVLVEPWTLCSSTNYKVRLLHCNDDSCDWEKMDVVKVDLLKWIRFY